ncbi:Conjugative transposon protein TcpC [Curtobacterium sp. 9128]|nr:Conjugative transposon protein TcpC [Curtobacterium sp. 9128]
MSEALLSRRELRERRARAESAQPTRTVDAWARSATAAPAGDVEPRPVGATGWTRAAPASTADVPASAALPSPSTQLSIPPVPVSTAQPAPIVVTSPTPVPASTTPPATSVSVPVPTTPSAAPAPVPTTPSAAPSLRPSTLPVLPPPLDREIRSDHAPLPGVQEAPAVARTASPTAGTTTEPPTAPPSSPTPLPHPDPVSAPAARTAPPTSPTAAVESAVSDPPPRRAGTRPRAADPQRDTDGGTGTLRSSVTEVVRDVVGLGSRGGRRSWVRTIQILVASATVLTLAVGLRSIFAPVSASSTPASATFPQAVAASTAERFAEVYFTWDESDRQARTEALSQLMVGGTPGQAGWDGKGTSTAGAARAAGFTYVDASHAIVTVVVPVTTPDADGTDATSTMSLQVPVTVVGARVWVSGLPASVGVPAAAPTGTASSFRLDAQTSARSRPAVAKYFAALSRGDVALSETGNASTGLDGTLQYTELLDWRVERGGDDQRVGFAEVRWATPGGAVLDQEYRLVISRNGSGWQVRAATASVPTD